MDNEQLDRDSEEHQDWLDGQASDRVARERFERDNRRGWTVTTSDFAGRDILITGWKRGIVFEFTQDEAVIFAHAILSEVELARTHCPICNDTFVVAVAGPDENGQYDTEDCPCQT